MPLLWGGTPISADINDWSCGISMADLFPPPLCGSICVGYCFRGLCLSAPPTAMFWPCLRHSVFLFVVISEWHIGYPFSTKKRSFATSKTESHADRSSANCVPLIPLDSRWDWPLSVASWAFRFAGSLPGVQTVLSGMTCMTPIVTHSNKNKHCLIVQDFK